MLAPSQPNLAIPYLEASLHADKTRSAAQAFLAIAFEKLGRDEEARRRLEAAHALAPAWGQLLPMLAAIFKRLGDHRQAEAWMEKHREQQIRTQILARRLSESSTTSTVSG